MSKLAFQLKSIVLVFVLSYSIFLILNINNLKEWSLSGDDLYSLTNSIPSFKRFVDLCLKQFNGQYRHLTYYLFNFYKLFLPNFFLIFLLHGLIFSIIPTLTYLSVRKYLGKYMAYFVIIPIFFTPIFYYHNYTISSLANIMMCIVSLIMIIYFQNRERLNSHNYSLFFLLITIISFTIKETFVLPLTIFCLVQTLSIKNSKNKLFFLIIPFVLFIVYLFAKFSVYQNDSSGDYYFNFSLNQIATNITNMFAWIINYPKGWQYGAPIRQKLLNYFISLITLLTIFINLITVFIKDKFNFLCFSVFIVSSISIFLFLNNTHVFYMDLPFLLILISFSRATSLLINKNKKLAHLLIFTLITINIVTSLTIKPQWLRYSFVAKANQAAKNYQLILEENSFESYDQICISNHIRGSFGTEEGNLVNHLHRGNFKIISIEEKTLPEDCNKRSSLNLKNDAWSYNIYR